MREISNHGPLGVNLEFREAYVQAVRAGKAVDLPVEAVREVLLAIGYSAIYLAPLVSMISERDLHDETVWQEWTRVVRMILRRGLLIGTPPVEGEYREHGQR